MTQATVTITYQDGGGNITEREISEIQLIGNSQIEAFCHFRNEYRTFNLSGVKSAAKKGIMQVVGEPITDFYKYVGATPPKPIQEAATVTEPPDLPPNELLKLKKLEKNALWSRFWSPVVIKIHRDKLLALFDSKCFLCGSTENLHIDHHVPFKRGGHLVPGNLSVLCRRCNSTKGDLNPDLFYVPEELVRIKPLLESQKAIFEFKFDRERWRNDKRQYLLDLGASKELVEEAFNNEISRYHIG